MNVKPMPYWKTFTLKRHLEKMTRYRLYYNRYSKTNYSIQPDKIVLSFIEPLELEDLKTLLQHEELHLKKTGSLTIDEEDAMYISTLNIAEDWFINEDVDLRKLKTIYRKLDSPMIGIIPLLPDDVARREIETLKKTNILKDSYSTNEILSIFKEVLNRRRSKDSIQRFYESNKDYLRKHYFPLFNIDKVSEIGDGPCDFDSYYHLPDWGIKREFDKLLKRFIYPTFDTIYNTGLYGKRFNDRFAYDDLCYDPFKHNKEIVEIKSPRICLIMDMSGSMEGDPEKIGKALAMSILQNIPNSVCILHNEYFTRICTVPESIVKVPATGDEKFDILSSRTEKWKDCDVLIIISDLEISKTELEGLNDIIANTKARSKCCLVVDKYNFNKDNVKCRKFLCTDKAGMIEAVKRLSLQFR